MATGLDIVAIHAAKALAESRAAEEILLEPPFPWPVVSVEFSFYGIANGARNVDGGRLNNSAVG